MAQINLHHLQKKAAKFSGFDKLRKHKQSLIGGGNLIICPLALIGQWKLNLMFVNIGNRQRLKAFQNQGLCQFMFTMGKVVQKMPKY